MTPRRWANLGVGEGLGVKVDAAVGVVTLAGRGRSGSRGCGASYRGRRSCRCDSCC
jgi:hypothetical protein